MLSAIETPQLLTRKMPTPAEKAAACIADQEMDQFHFKPADLQLISSLLNARVKAHSLPEAEAMRWEMSARIAAHFANPANFRDTDRNSYLTFDELVDQQSQFWFRALAVSLVDGQIAAELGFKPTKQPKQLLAWYTPVVVLARVVSVEVGFAIASVWYAADWMVDKFDKLTHKGPWAYVDKLVFREVAQAQETAIDRLQRQAEDFRLVHELIINEAVRSFTLGQSLDQLEDSYRPEPPAKSNGVQQIGTVSTESAALDKLTEGELCDLYRWLLLQLGRSPRERPMLTIRPKPVALTDERIVQLLHEVAIKLQRKYRVRPSECSLPGGRGKPFQVDLFNQVITIPATERQLPIGDLFRRVEPKIVRVRAEEMIRELEAIQSETRIDISVLIRKLRSASHPADAWGFIFQAQRVLYYASEGRLRAVEKRFNNCPTPVDIVIVGKQGEDLIVEVKNWTGLGQYGNPDALVDHLDEQLRRLRQIGPVQLDWKGPAPEKIRQLVDKYGITLNPNL